MELGWFALALLDALFAALVAILAKAGLQNVDPTLATAVRTVVMTAFMLAVVLVTGKAGSLGALTSRDGLFILLSGLAGAISWLLYFSALKLGDASKVSAVDRSSLLFVVAMSFLFLGEELTLKTVLAAAFIFIGLLIIAL
jgi:bacterial/archaeal transporter family protein